MVAMLLTEWGQVAMEQRWKSTKYSGADEIRYKERWAVEYGPLLLAAGGRGGVTVNMDPNDPGAWLKRISQNRFKLCGCNNREYLVYMDIDDEPFVVYPIVERPEK